MNNNNYDTVYDDIISIIIQGTHTNNICCYMQCRIEMLEKTNLLMMIDRCSF